MTRLAGAVGAVVFLVGLPVTVQAGPAQRGPVPAVEAGLAQKPEVADAIQLLESWIESQMAYRGIPG